MSTTAPADPSARPSRRATPAYVRVLKPLASLQLTVGLFALSVVLVFFGTVAQMHSGLWTVVDQYFRSAVVWIPVELVRKFGTVFFDLPKDSPAWPGSFPFPGGWLIGSGLLVNLVAAHLVRFKLTWKRAGVVVLHAGVVALMLGELVTGLWAVESTMTMKIGESTDYVDVTREMELAVVDRSDPAAERFVCVPQWMLERRGVVRDPALPFDLEVVDYWRNSSFDLARTKPDGVRSLPTPMGWFKFEPRAEGVGVDNQIPPDTPAVVVKPLDKTTGAPLGEFFLSVLEYPNFALNHRRFDFPPQSAEVGGRAYGLQLRNKRVYKNYDVELLKFEHGKYPGTDMAKDFASTVRVTDKAGGDGREVRIWMNNPLRYQGDSLFQHEVLIGDSGTVLQVVRNPGRLLPYVSCTMITLGMLLHFGIRLSGFLRKRAAA